MSSTGLPDPSALSLLDLPLRDALARFGRRSPVPGAGSAAALTGSLAARLARAADLGARRGELDRLAEELAGLAAEDAAAFQRFWRQLRDGRGKERDEVAKMALGTALETATRIPITIARACLAVTEVAAMLEHSGLPAARAEAVAARELAAAAGRAACFVARENLRFARLAPWTEAARGRLAEIETRLAERPGDAIQRTGSPNGG
jgi:formiminotetrahydrofolate cyclodeaminase